MKVQQESQALRILTVAADDRRQVFVVETSSDTYNFPRAKLQEPATLADRVATVWETACHLTAFTYTFDYGREGTLHMDQVLDHNREPGQMLDLACRLILEAENRPEASCRGGIGIRHLARRLKASPSPSTASSNFGQMDRS